MTPLPMSFHGVIAGCFLVNTRTYVDVTPSGNGVVEGARVEQYLNDNRENTADIILTWYLFTSCWVWKSAPHLNREYRMDNACFTLVPISLIRLVTITAVSYWRIFISTGPVGFMTSSNRKCFSTELIDFFVRRERPKKTPFPW